MILTRQAGSFMVEAMCNTSGQTVEGSTGCIGSMKYATLLFLATCNTLLSNIRGQMVAVKFEGSTGCIGNMKYATLLFLATCNTLLPNIRGQMVAVKFE